MHLSRTARQAAAPITAALLFLAAPAQAQHAGWRTLTVAGDTTVALLYPTAVADRAWPMGPWLPVVAAGAPAAQARLQGLILISHGTGGSDLGHHKLGTRLARDGYLVAAVRHTGDNWQDRSLVSAGRYFSERPRQLSRVLDALLASPQWGPRIPADRIGAVGHSAGGYSVLAPAGAMAEPQRAARHGRTVTDDPGFCAPAQASAGSPQASASAPGQPANATPPDADLVAVPDRRFRAVVALAPMAVVFTPASLAAITVPVRVLIAEKDVVLHSRHHGGHVVAHQPGALARPVAGAGHFAFMSPSAMPLPSAAGDAAADPAGFDRAAFLRQLEDRVAGFFADQWR